MNTWLLCSALLTLVIGLVHSVMGEQRIFRHLRAGGIAPTQGGPALREFQVRILWASWHLATCFGWAISALLFWLAAPGVAPDTRHGLVWIAVLALAAAALIVAGATRGRHPGWIAMLIAAVLACADLA